MRNFPEIILREFVYVKLFFYRNVGNNSLKIFLHKVCFCFFWNACCGGFAPASLSLSLSLCRSRSLRACDCGSGLACRSPFFLPMAPIAPAFSARNRFVGTLEFPWLVLCVVFRCFPDFCVLDTSECCGISRTPMGLFCRAWC